MFPHHECEIAQSVAAQGKEAVKYWMHNNMITINGKKMGKSYGNFITLRQFYEGSHPLLTQAYHPMVIRFFILQAHYRSTVDFSNEALQASEKALKKMTDIYRRLHALKPAEKSEVQLPDFDARAAEAIDDDLNTPQVIAVLFEAGKAVNAAADGIAPLDGTQIETLKKLFDTYLVEILGVRPDNTAEADAATDTGAASPFAGAVDLLMEVRANAKASKDWATSDMIRDRLAALGFDVKDTKSGVEWSLK